MSYKVKKNTAVGSAVKDLYDKKHSRRSRWQDLEMVYRAKMEAVGQFGQLAKDLLSDSIVNDNIKQKQIVANLVKTLANDLTTFADTLQGIRARHSHKTGLIINGDDIVLSFECYESYMQTDEELQAIVIPTMALITAAIQEVENTVIANNAVEKTNIVENVVTEPVN